MSIAIEDIESGVVQLSQDKLKEFRTWFEKFDSKSWDDQIESDIVLGKVDDLANAAIADHKLGKSTRL